MDMDEIQNDSIVHDTQVDLRHEYLVVPVLSTDSDVPATYDSDTYRKDFVTNKPHFPHVSHTVTIRVPQTGYTPSFLLCLI